MRVLWFHPRSWAGARHGGDLRTEGLLRCVVALNHEVVLVVPPGEDQWQVPGVQVLTAPGPRSRAALALRKVASSDPLRAPQIARGRSAPLAAELEALSPDAVLVSEVMSWSLARRLAPSGLPLVYDAQNVEGELFAAHARAAKGLQDRVTFAVDARRVARAEQALLRRADEVLAVSEEDRTILSGLAGHDRVHVVPSSVDPPLVLADPGQAGPVALFVGTLDYPPNVAAVAELVGLWRAVRQSVPQARLEIVGRRPSAQVLSAVTGASGVTVYPDVASLDPHYRRARVAVAPLRSGGGTKLKVYEAMARGLTVVGTDSALRGIPVADDDVVRADSPGDIVEALVRLLSDPREAVTRGESARRTFIERLTWERAAAEPLARVLASLVPFRD